MRMLRVAVQFVAAASLATAAMAQSVDKPAPGRTDLVGRADASVAPARPSPTREEMRIASPITAAYGPVRTSATAGVRNERPAAATPAPLPRRNDERKNIAMMAVGGAGLIVGAIIGKTPGTIIMVGSAGVGLYGLYKYLE